MTYSVEDMKKRIKLLKKEKNINSDELSELSGVPIGTLNKLLGAATREPSINTVIKIAQALDVSADYLILGVSRSALNEQEQRLIDAYNAHPEMQPAINKMLDIEDNDEMKQMLKADKYSDNKKGTELKRA